MNFMYRLSTTIVLIFVLVTKSMGQSIPSYWMNIYSLEDYYAVMNQEVAKVDVQKTGYYSSGEKYKEEWNYNFLEPNEIKGELFMNGELKTKFTFIFDGSGRRVKNVLETKLPLVGWNRESVVFEYSAEGNRSFEKRYDSFDRLVSTTAFKYDSLNHLTQITNYDVSGNISSYETAEYNYGELNYLYKVYDSDGRLVSQETKNCNIYSHTNSKNNFGDFTKVVWPTSSPEKNVYHEFSYKYDTNGNWTEREWFVVTDGKRKKNSVVKRNIKYRN